MLNRPSGMPAATSDRRPRARGHVQVAAIEGRMLGVGDEHVEVVLARDGEEVGELDVVVGQLEGDARWARTTLFPDRELGGRVAHREADGLGGDHQCVLLVDVEVPPGDQAVGAVDTAEAGGDLGADAVGAGRFGDGLSHEVNQPLTALSTYGAACEQLLARGETGEICVRGDLIMKGYYKAPDKTAETIIDGWLHTGDIGHIDASGYLHLTDRKKDMIITGGFNVYPATVEQVIWGHPAVQDCAVIGVPDPKWGEAVKAVVELVPGQSVSAEEIIALCKDQLGSVMAPKSVDFVPALPRSPVGKVLKKDLRAAYWQGHDKKI